MGKYALCIVLFLVLPASATISYVRSNATWSGGTSSCAVGLSTISPNDLIVVWGEWQTSGANTITSSISDSHPLTDTFQSAVGPTVQATGNIAAQIFYLPNIQQTSDTVTLTFSGAVSSPSACVIAEFSGADPFYPLDSVSAGYSTTGNPTTLLDSGNAAPANSNLIVFAAGFADTNAALHAGAGFTSRQASNGTWGTGIVESSTAALSGNNALQRATACLSSLVPCPTSPTGDWLMQMAVFRDASWTVGGGWSPTRPPDVINAAQYPGPDICVKAGNAGVANPHATILMPISGNTNPCSVNPFTGSTDSSPVSSPPTFLGNIKVVSIGGGPATIQYTVPWTMIGAQNSSVPGQVLDLGGVEMDPDTTVTTGFYATQTGNRCVTAAAAVTDGSQNACNTGSVTTISIAPGSGATAGCALITIPAPSSSPYYLYGGEWVNIMHANDPRNNFAGRAVPSGDTSCGGTMATQGPAISLGSETFLVQAPSMQACSSGGTSCGSNILITWESPTFNMAPRPWDEPDGTHICLGVDGRVPTGTMPACQRFGNKIINAGTILNAGYGSVGIKTGPCEEQCGVDNSQNTRTIMKASMLSYSMLGGGAMNNDAIKHLEDYCGSPNPADTSGCSAHGKHVGMAIRDTWFHGIIEDVTFNNNAYAGVMFDGMGGFSADSAITGIHFQNRVNDNTMSPVTYAGGNLGNIVLGQQASASNLVISHIESNASNAVACNICIMGSMAIPVNLPNWSAGGAGKYYPYDSAIKPANNNGQNPGGYVYMVRIAGTAGSTEPNPWNQNSTSGMNTQTDGSITWVNVGTNLPNVSIASSAAGGGNVVKAINIANDANNNGATPTIWNGNTGLTWTDDLIADYTYQADGSSVYECSSDSEHPCRTDQGLNVANIFTVNNAGAVTASNLFGTLGAVHFTGQTATKTIYTLCTAPAGGSCGTAGQYRINWYFNQGGTACGAPSPGGVTFALTWTDNAGAHSAIPLPMFDATSLTSLSTSFHFQTSNAAAYASGEFNIWSTGAQPIQVTNTWTSCGGGLGTWELTATAERVQ